MVIMSISLTILPMLLKCTWLDSLNADEKGNFLVMAGKAMKDYAFLLTYC